MLGRLYCLECFENLAMFVDQKRDSSRRCSFLVEDAVSLANSLLCVGEEREGQMELLGEFLVRLSAVYANSQDFGAFFADLLVLIS